MRRLPPRTKDNSAPIISDKDEPLAARRWTPSPRAVRAHALKNCLSLIYAVSRLIESDVAERSRPRLARIHEMARRMSALIDEDLQPEPPHAQGDAPFVSVSEVVRVVRERALDAAEAGRIQLIVTCGGGSVRGHVTELTEALLNLVTNAIQATAVGGVVAIATFITPDGDQQWIVQDTGCGIPVERLADLGQPYRSYRPGGSGIGVAMARDVVARHGGLFAVESKVGTGTTVSVWLPREGPCMRR